MLLTITTPDRTIAQDQEISGVFVETTEGPLTILDHHASLVTTSSSGSLRVVAGNETDGYILRNATLEVDNATNTLKILALSCQLVSEVDQLDLQKYLEQLQASLSAENFEPSSLRLKFLKEEKIAVERLLQKR